MGCLNSKNKDTSFDYSTGSNTKSNSIVLESTKPYIPPSYPQNSHLSSKGNNNNNKIIISDSEAIILASNYCKTSAFQWQDEALIRIGSRNSKWNFIVSGTDSESSKTLSMVLSLISVQDFPISLVNQSTMDVFGNLLCALTHPYIYPCEDVDYIKDKHILVTVRKFNEKGSLKDLIYGKQNPKHKYLDKYRQDYSRPLRPKIIKTFGRHILEALSALNAKGIICDNLKASNVLLDNGIARLSELETTLLGNGIADDIFDIIVEYEIKNEGKICSIDVLLFGFLLLEMISGVPFYANNFFNEISEEFSSRFISLNSSPENELLHTILVSIFISCDATIESLLGNEFFQSVELIYTPQKIKLQKLKNIQTQEKLKELEESDTADEIVNKRRNKSIRRGSSSGTGNNNTNSTTSTTTSTTTTSTASRRRQSLLSQHQNSINSTHSNSPSNTPTNKTSILSTRGSEESTISPLQQTPPFSSSSELSESLTSPTQLSQPSSSSSSSSSSVPPQYQKLLNIGLSQEAVKHKMINDGFDPASCGW